MSRIPHFVDNRLTDGREVVSVTRRPLFTFQKYLLIFIRDWVNPVAMMKLEGLGKLEKTHYLRARNVAPQPSTLPSVQNWENRTVPYCEPNAENPEVLWNLRHIHESDVDFRYNLNTHSIVLIWCVILSRDFKMCCLFERYPIEASAALLCNGEMGRTCFLVVCSGSL
jgi:hypothetical protein